MGNAVVEHKAQTHFESFLQASRFLSEEMRDAPMYFREGRVRPLDTVMYSAV